MTVRPVTDAVLREEVRQSEGRDTQPRGVRRARKDARAAHTGQPGPARHRKAKYTGDTSYPALFHKDPRRPGVVADLVRECGWESGEHVSFRHTIWGRSARGFEVRVGPERVSVYNARHPDIAPYWDIDDLTNSAVTKLRNLCRSPAGWKSRAGAAP